LYKKHQNLASFYTQFFILFSLQFFITYFIRYLFLSKAHRQLQREEVWFNTLIIGNQKKAKELFDSINSNNEKTGYRVRGFISSQRNNGNELNQGIEYLGDIHVAKNVIDKHVISEVIIALQKEEREELEKILQMLAEKEVNVKMMPD
jgi:FlaA1/EpsC-like NDP-sugar epimerase